MRIDILSITKTELKYKINSLEHKTAAMIGSTRNGGWTSASIERRGSARLRTLKGGLIIFGTAPAVECIIRNMSESGALLAVNSAGIPDKFTLLIKPEMRKRDCQVIWRSTDKLGVRFL